MSFSTRRMAFVATSAAVSTVLPPSHGAETQDSAPPPSLSAPFQKSTNLSRDRSLTVAAPIGAATVREWSLREQVDGG
jgi:hypothetical protein